MSVFEETIQEVHDQKSGATAGETSVGQAPPAEATTETETSDPVVEPQAADEGAREVEAGEAQPTTDEELSLTGLESPEDLERQHGSDWSVKTARRVLPLVKQAGGMQNLRLSAEMVADIRNPEVRGGALLEKIKGVSESRAGEIRRDIFWDTLDLPGQFDLVLQDKLQSEFPDHPLTLDFIKQAVQNEIQYSTGQSVEPADDLSDLPAAVQEKLKAYDDLMKKFPEMEKRVTGFEEQQRTSAEQRAQEEVQQWGSELYQSIFSVVEERKKELGLDIQPTDSDEVKFIKQDLQELLAEEKLVQAFEQDAENLQQSQLAVSYLGKRDKQAAFSYAPTLRMGALKTLEQALRNPRVAQKFTQLKSVMESQSTPKQTARPEVVQGTPAGFTAPDPYEEGVKAGLSPFDVAVQQAGRAVAR